MDLKSASERAYEIAQKRGQYKKDGQDVLRDLKHCAGEVLEAMNAYGEWCNEDYFTTKEDFENELADIVICVLSISAEENIDIEKAIARKMLINEGRAKNGLCK
jgi:NTP pyrophosphatase (non-canonical NTP hydrolase)